MQHWYTYICDENQADYLPALQETIRFQYHTREEIQSLRSFKDFGRFTRDWNLFNQARRRDLRPLIKDPFAVFSAPWFHKTLNCQVLLVVRHPAPFASSLKRLGWSFDFNHLLAQPLLLRDRLGNYKNELEKVTDQVVDIIDQACLLWRIIYSNVIEYLSQYPQIKVVRHEDLSKNPLENFQGLYEDLGLTFNPQAEAKIIESTRSPNPKFEWRNSPHNIKINSLENLDAWKQYLTPDEASRIEAQTSEISAAFYPEWVEG